MKKLDFIFRRRSIRKFTADSVADGDVRSLLEAAMAAPSACAKDPARFIVMSDRAVLAAVAALLPNGQFLAQAPLGIVVLGDIGAAHGNELSYMLQDCSAAIENMLLAADALGLGACWLGVHPREDRMAGIKAYFQLPEELIPVSVIAIGHPAESREPRTRFNPSYVQYNSWIG